MDCRLPRRSSRRHPALRRLHLHCRSRCLHLHCRSRCLHLHCRSRCLHLQRRSRCLHLQRRSRCLHLQRRSRHQWNHLRLCLHRHQTEERRPVRSARSKHRQSEARLRQQWCHRSGSPGSEVCYRTSRHRRSRTCSDHVTVPARCRPGQPEDCMTAFECTRPGG